LAQSSFLSCEPFDKGAQIFQDFDLLVDLRNVIVHAKSKEAVMRKDERSGKYVWTSPQPQLNAVFRKMSRQSAKSLGQKSPSSFYCFSSIRFAKVLVGFLYLQPGFFAGDVNELSAEFRSPAKPGKI